MKLGVWFKLEEKKNKFDNKDKYFVSKVILKQLLENNSITEDEFIRSDYELQKIYGIKKSYIM